MTRIRFFNSLLMIGFALTFASATQAQTPTPTATPTSTEISFPALRGCTQITKKVGVKVSGRFGWKPVAAHFNAAVIVAPRLYSLPREKFAPPTVWVYKPSGKLLFQARLKSIGLCNGVGEDFCANTYLTPIGKPGGRIEKLYGPVVVVIRPQKGSTKGCRFYYVPHPKARVQYENK